MCLPNARLRAAPGDQRPAGRRHPHLQLDGGYYYAATEEELRRTIRQLRSRIKKIAFAERGLSRTLPDYEDTGQLSLPLEGGDTS